MPRSLISILIISVFSLQTSKNNLGQEKLILGLIEKIILTDSLNQQSFISSKLLPYSYYELKFTSDGIEIPPPNGYEWINEKVFLDQVELANHFSGLDNKAHVKHQILSSQKYSEKLKLNQLGDEILGSRFKDSDSWYTFYLPIFNIDSTAVYIQYDHYDNGFGEGNAALLVKKEKGWIYKESIPGWIK